MSVLSRSILLILVCGWAGCFDRFPPDGALKCAKDPNAACPPGFFCAADQTCWRTGHNPDLSMRLDDGGFGDGASLPGDGFSSDGSLDAAVDLGPCVNLQCSQMQCDSGSTTVSGVVYTPSGALPLANVVVYVPNGSPAPMPTGLVPGTCPACFATVSGSPITLTITDANGAFTLSNVPAGDQIPLVMQVGRWRRQVKIPHVDPCTNTPVDAQLTHLPRTHIEGDIPLHAITTSGADAPECLLRLAGIDDSEFTSPQDPGRVHIYEGTASGGSPMIVPDGGVDAGAVDTMLWNDPTRWQQYDVLLFACEGGPFIKSSTMTSSFANYTGSGGRVFLTHYDFVWLQVAPFSSVASFFDDSMGFGESSSLQTNVDTGSPKGATLATWLEHVDAGAQFPLDDWRHDYTAVTPPTRRLLYATTPSPSPGPAAVQFSFETPVGASQQCGHVVYSDFHASRPNGPGIRFPTECGANTPGPAEPEMIFMLFDQPTCVP